MLTATIGIDAGAEGNIRAVVVGDDGLGMVTEKLGARSGIVLGVPINIAFECKVLEAIGRVAASAASAE
jgi:hypothetical protein